MLVLNYLSTNNTVSLFRKGSLQNIPLLFILDYIEKLRENRRNYLTKIRTYFLVKTSVIEKNISEIF